MLFATTYAVQSSLSRMTPISVSSSNSTPSTRTGDNHTWSTEMTTSRIPTVPLRSASLLLLLCPAMPTHRLAIRDSDWSTFERYHRRAIASGMALTVAHRQRHDLGLDFKANASSAECDLMCIAEYATEG